MLYICNVKQLANMLLSIASIRFKELLRRLTGVSPETFLFAELFDRDRLSYIHLIYLLCQTELVRKPLNCKK